MDLSIFNFFHFLAGQSGFFDSFIIFFAKYLSYLLVLAAIFFIFRQSGNRRKFSIFIFTALTVLLSRGLVTEIIRFFYDRPRPFEVLNAHPILTDSNPSFPSGHAAFFFALALAIFYFDRKWGWWFLGLAFLNSLARISAGVHWPTDVIGGFLIAAAAFLIIKKILPKLN